MYAGRIVETGSAEEVFTRPLHPYAAALSGAFPRIGDPAARYAPAGLPGTRRTRGTCRPAARSRRAVRWPSTDAERPSPPWRGTVTGRLAACIRVGDGPADAVLPGPRRLRRVRQPRRAGGARPRRRRHLRGARRGARARRGVGVGQDHAGPDPGGPGATDRWPGAASTGSRSSTARVRCKAFRRRVQMVLQDAAGRRSTRGRPSTSRWPRGSGCTRSPNRPEGRTEAELVAAGDVRGGSAAARAAVPAIPARALRWAATAGADRRRAGAAARAAGRRRAGVEPRRLDPRRDPRAAAAASRRARPGGPRGHPRPRAGVEHRRPYRRDVPRPGGRVGADRGGPAAPRHPYTQALLSVVPEIERLEPLVLRGEIPDPTRIPPGCRFHPRCPALAVRGGRAAGVATRAAAAAGGAARRRRPRCACHLRRCAPPR